MESSLEEKIVDALSTRYSTTRGDKNLLLHNWSGTPYEFRPWEIEDDLPSIGEGPYVKCLSWSTANSLIKEADLTLCLTSKFLYIRECKMYYERLK